MKHWNFYALKFWEEVLEIEFSMALLATKRTFLLWNEFKIDL